jgi:hypothetical protein
MSVATMIPNLVRTMPTDHSEQGQAVKIALDVVTKGGTVASRRRKPNGKRMTLAEYFSELLRPLVERDYLDEVEQMHREAQQMRHKSSRDDS